MSEELPKPEIDWKAKCSAMYHKSYDLAQVMEYAAQAIKELPNAGDQYDRSGYYISQAAKHLQNALVEYNFATPWKPEDAELSSNFHTYLRKFDDTPMGTVMYMMKANDRGGIAWRYIIENWKRSFRDIGYILDEMNASSLDDIILAKVFITWGSENFVTARKNLKEWMKEE